MEKEKLIKKLMWVVHSFEDYLNTGYRSILPDLHITTSDHQKNRKDDLPRDKQLELIKEKILHCTSCYLHYNRNHALPGVGTLDPEVFIVGNGPGEEEDTLGKPFAGKAGDYLDRWLEAIGLNMSKSCFACNIVRCKPPQNREPRKEETGACLPFLEKQIQLVKPKAILCLGRIPGQVLTGKSVNSVAKLRDQPYSYKDIPLIVTYHPSSVLQDKELRKPVWEDLQSLKEIIKKRNGK